MLSWPCQCQLQRAWTCKVFLCLQTALAFAGIRMQGRDVARQCSIPVISGSSASAALGGVTVPSLLSPWEIIPMSVACNCCEQWMAEDSLHCCHTRKRLLIYCKAALSFICSSPQSGKLHHDLYKKIHWVWLCVFWWGFWYCFLMGFFWLCFAAFSPWTVNS